jgi:hypothetical protein
MFLLIITMHVYGYLLVCSSGGAREQIIGVHSGAKTTKKPFLGVAHMVKNCSYTKKTKITRGPVHPPG